MSKCQHWLRGAVWDSHPIESGGHTPTDCRAGGSIRGGGEFRGFAVGRLARLNNPDTHQTLKRGSDMDGRPRLFVGVGPRPSAGCQGQATGHPLAVEESEEQGGGSHEHLQEYLDEYVFRFNRRHTRNRGLVCMRLLQRAVASKPVTCRALVRISRPKATHPHRRTRQHSRPPLDARCPDHRPSLAASSPDLTMKR